MRLQFAKLNGAGNDFVMVEDLVDEVTLTPGQVKQICNRHFGVGADGVILVKPSPREECAAYMDYYNSDGTKAEMCGNGVRCFAKFLVDRGIVSASAGSFVADTLAGPRPIAFELGRDGKLALATVDMGAPILEPEAIPTTLPGVSFDAIPTRLRPAVAPPGTSTPVIAQPVKVDAGEFKFTVVSMGNPHAVTFVDDPLTFPLEEVGPQVECAPEFPEKTNVEFARVQGKVITMRVWERGCGETLACGTGACATAVAANLYGLCGRKVDLKLLGGTLNIEWRAEDNHVYMTGPAAQYFTGELEIDEERLGLWD